MPTVTKSQLSQMSFRTMNMARSQDIDNNGYVSKTEAGRQNPGRTTDQYARFAALHKQALTALRRSSSVTPGQLYGYAKQLGDEMRKIMDTRGNKDHQLQPRELRYLSAGAKALVKLYEAMQRPKGKLVELPPQPPLPTPARPAKPKPQP